MTHRTPALLALEDGSTWPGTALGAIGERAGEVIFNTAMTGYQEVLTDPSYYGQIVVMTAPHIGNTGVNLEDEESARPWLSGFAVRAASPRVSSWRANAALDQYLRDHGVVGITGLDTRALVRHIREAGALRGVISSADPDPQRLIDAARAAPSMEGLDLVPYVTCAEPYHWAEAGDRCWVLGDGGASSTQAPTPSTQHLFHVVAYDFGIKRNILRLLVDRGCRVTVVPANTPAAGALALKPDGVFLSNGPGDPAAVTSGVKADPGAGAGRHHLQAALRPPRRQPAGALQRYWPGRDIQPQPRLRGRPEIAAGGRRDHARQLERRLLRRDARARSAGVQRAVSPRGRAGAARRGIFIWPVYRADEGINAQAHRHTYDSDHWLRPDCDRPGLRVRLRRRASLQGAAP